MTVVHVELGRHLYGGARQVAYLLNGIGPEDGRHVLICLPGSGVERAIANPRVEIRPLAMRGDLDLGFVFRLRRVLVETGARLMHVHSRKGDLPALWAARLAGVPAIYSRRVDNPPNWADRHLKFLLCRRVVTISEGILAVLRGAGVAPDKLHCIPSAIDTALYPGVCSRERFEAEFGLAPGTPTVGMVAQLIERKGHAVLFEALARILPRHPRLRVLIFGQGPLEAELKQRAASLGLADHLHFAGFRRDLPDILPCLSILAHPAWMEGLGVSLLEAAASGVPIVACRAGGMPEVVEDGVTGYLIAPGDAPALADRLDRLLDDPEQAAIMGRAGRERVHRRFAIAGMVAGNLALYRQWLDR
ncbi:MAG: glycosyltransferase [Pseudomonadota bacterium]